MAGKMLLTATALAWGAFSLNAQTAHTEITDSIANTELEEVVVHGRTQKVIKYGVEYTPDKQTKKAAIDATGLLSLMQLPQLRVSPGSSTVTTSAGQSVSYFIDYVPASQQDLAGLRPEDVLKVEVLDYPGDPRFNSAQHVVHYRMIQYEWGGYTKFSLFGRMPHSESIDGSAYSKFVYKGWTFDVSLGGSGSHNDKNLTNSVEQFRDLEFMGRHYDEITRTTRMGDNYLYKSNSLWTTARARYQKQNMLIQHTLYFTRSGMPESRYEQEVLFSIPELSSLPARSSTKSQSLTPGIGGYYFFSLPHGQSLQANWDMSYSRTHRNSLYRLQGFDGIINNNQEDTYAPSFNASYSKRFAYNNTFRTSVMSYNTIYDTKYLGSYQDKQKVTSSENMLFLEYMQYWKFGLSLYSRVGASYVIGRVNGKNTLHQWNPRLGLQLQWQVNRNHSVSLEGWWGNSHPQASTSNSATVQSNELMWLKGNPDLKNVIFAQSTLGYNFIPNNVFSMSANLQYEGNYDKLAYRYFTEPEHDGLIRSYINSGNAHAYRAILGAGLSLLNGKLKLSANGNASNVVLTGSDAQHLTTVSGYAEMQFFLGNFSTQLFYNSPYKNLNGYSMGEIAASKSFYGIVANYALGGWKFRIQYNNWFNSHIYTHNYYKSALYSSNTYNWDGSLNHTVNLSVTYTFSYGKKILHDDEVGNKGSAGSAILK